MMDKEISNGNTTLKNMKEEILRIIKPLLLVDQKGLHDDAQVSPIV
jgi:hypothetical protein